MPIWLTIALQVIEMLSKAVANLAPLVQQGQAVFSQTDVLAVHAALRQAEDATALLRPQVDAALEAASQK